MFKKRVLSLLVILSMLCSIGAMAAARWSSQARITPSISRNGNAVTCQLKVRAMSVSDRISADVSLEKQRSTGTWEVLGSWNDQTGTGSLDLSKTYQGTKATSGTYRLVYSVTVTSSKGSDVIDGEKEVKL